VGVTNQPTTGATPAASPPAPPNEQILRDPNWAQRYADFTDRHRKPLLIILFLFLLCGFNGQWHLGPDSGLYLSLGQNLANGRGYTYHGLPHGMVYPGLPYALATLFKIFHSQNAVIAAADALMLACGLGVLAATYRLVDLAFNRPSAVIVTLGVGITREFYRYCFEILTDMPFLLGVMMFLAGQEAIFQSIDQHHRKIRWFDWTLLIVGLIIAITTRPTMIGLLTVWIVSMIWTAIRKKNLRPIALITTIVIAALIALFIRFDPRHAVNAIRSESYETTVLNDLTSNLQHRLSVDVPANFVDLFALSAARSAFGMPLGTWWINAIFGSIILAASLALIRKRLLWALWIAVTLAILILIQSHDRYMLEILPLLVLGWWRLMLTMNRLLPRKLGNAIFILMLILGTLPNMVQSGAIALHQRLISFSPQFRDPEFQVAIPLAQDLKKFTTPDEIIFCPIKLSRILTFLANRNVYEATDPGNGEFSTHPSWVIYDPTDLQLRIWLTTHQVQLNPKPIATISRGKISPLELLQTKLNP
jgi:hypothetical protein